MNYIKSLFKLRNLGTTTFALFLFVLGNLIFASIELFDLSASLGGISNFSINFGIGAIISIIYMIISVSTYGEWCLRKRNKAHLVITSENTQRVIGIFDNVYKHAKEANKSIGSKVKLYYYESTEVNAFALGKNTIALSTVVFESGDDEAIAGLIAHEFGHIANADSFRTITFLSSTIMLGIMAFIATVVMIISSIVTALSTGRSMMSTIIFVIALPILLLTMAFKLIYNFLNCINNFLMNLSSRECEFKADAFAKNIGHLEGLVTVLEFFERNEGSYSIFHYFTGTHPRTKIRLEKLNKEKMALN